MFGLAVAINYYSGAHLPTLHLVWSGIGVSAILTAGPFSRDLFVRGILRNVDGSWRASGFDRFVNVEAQLLLFTYFIVSFDHCMRISLAFMHSVCFHSLQLSVSLFCGILYYPISYEHLTHSLAQLDRTIRFCVGLSIHCGEHGLSLGTALRLSSGNSRYGPFWRSSSSKFSYNLLQRRGKSVLLDYLQRAA